MSRPNILLMVYLHYIYHRQKTHEIEKKTGGPPNFKLGWISPPTHVNLTQQKKKQRCCWPKNAAIMAFRQPLVMKNTVVGEGWEESASTIFFEKMCYGLLIFARQEPMLVINICIPSLLYFFTFVYCIEHKINQVMRLSMFWCIQQRFQLYTWVSQDLEKLSKPPNFQSMSHADICKVQAFLDFIACAPGLLLQRCGFVTMNSDFLRDQKTWLWQFCGVINNSLPKSSK